jgi:tetratricopeptide (TPR) repeat protein
MNVSDFTSLINNPNAVNEKQTLALEKIVAEFPYFQSARALRLKGLYNQDSFRYNFDLKTTAAYTTDRSILFDLITSDYFKAINKDSYLENVEKIKSIDVISIEIVSEKENPSTSSNTLEQSILTSIKKADALGLEKSEIEERRKSIEKTEVKLEIGKPIAFSKNEKHSFQEWLQLSKITPINRDETITNDVKTAQIEAEKNKKLALIDKFIEVNPKIPPISKEAISKDFTSSSSEDKSYLMTETLAKVYLEQKKYQKAIQAYEILILKYPEKSSFFADRILDIQNLQQNNN